MRAAVPLTIIFVPMMKQADLTACAEQLRRMLDEIDARRILASPVQSAYLRGALETLEAIRRVR